MKIRRPGKTQEYILEQDRESDKPTIFEYRSLTWQEMSEVSLLSPMSMEEAFQINAIYQRAADEERELTDDEAKEIQSISKLDKDYLHKLNLQHAKACRIGLTRIRNLVDEDNQPIELTPEEFVNAADPGAIRELGTAIMNASKLREQDKKKF